MKLTVTGATGFVGGHLLDAAAIVGHSVTALTRRPQPERDGVEWIAGSLDDRAALDRLVADADAVIHVAGVVNAPDAAGFEAGNVTGTANILDAATKAGVKRFVHVSSLAAREPKLSEYGASKARSEAIVAAASISTVIVRPPAIYGPGDHELLEMFRMARRGFVLLPPAGRLSLIHAADLARLLVALAAPAAPTGIIEPDDGHPRGYSHVEFGQALGQAVGRRVRTLSMSAAILTLGAKADRLMRGPRAKLTPDRATYFAHPDWVADPARAPDPAMWSAGIPTKQGLADTAAWYRSRSLL
ncbi:MAG: NAD(P)-dependent oxidoreductase [Pseudomonadota bacterium]